jgi:hypothetical protein
MMSSSFIYKPVSKVKCSDQKGVAREQVIKSISTRPQYINQAAKKVQQEIYDRRYAIGNFNLNQRKKEFTRSQKNAGKIGKIDDTKYR